MPRLAYLVELDPVSIAQLDAARQLIGNLLDGIQIIQVPDEEAVWEDEGGALPPPEIEEERVPDPAFSPPPPTPPMNDQSDFGAGPPPSGGLG